MTANPRELHPRLARLDARAAALREQAKEAARDVQATCPHHVVLHEDHHSGIIFDSVPCRVCPRCGLSEDTWSFSEWTSSRLRDAPSRTIQRVARGSSARFRRRVD